jgi:hypothetical protein
VNIRREMDQLKSRLMQRDVRAEINGIRDAMKDPAVRHSLITEAHRQAGVSEDDIQRELQ